MQFNAAQIAKLIDGKIEGDNNALVSSFGKIETAQKGQLAFLANPKYEEHLYTTHASIIIINNSQEIKQRLNGTTLIRVSDAYSAFAMLLNEYQKVQTQELKGIQQPSYIPASTVLGTDVFIGAFSYLGENVKIGNNSKIFPNTYIGDNVQIGNDCVIYPGVKIYFGCILKNNVFIHSGSIIGSDGFGFAPQANGTFKKISQIGNVVIEDNVEIGSNTTIDRATMGSTLIREGAKLDNLIQIGHNAEVGKNTVIAAQAGVSGSTKIGESVMIGGQAGLVGHIQIADGSKINAQSGVSKSLKIPDTTVTGSPAYEHTSALRSQAIFRNLPEMEKRLKELENLVKQLLAEK
ncbi:MAG: UDP-3-O-(3-hydroxymyristoyl)glucosamine N-acyltransferase [Bacteroidota bacterium]|nr:UDP-3-O-(3-hydroxymyristoyl)glucosamine N-acyltransferase [Bacteroidota bacterium]